MQDIKHNKNLKKEVATPARIVVRIQQHHSRSFSTVHAGCATSVEALEPRQLSSVSGKELPLDTQDLEKLDWK